MVTQSTFGQPSDRVASSSGQGWQADDAEGFSRLQHHASKGLDGCEARSVLRVGADLLGARSGDEIVVDLFPGTGVMGDVAAVLLAIE
jgi:hypothetical protein